MQRKELRVFDPDRTIEILNNRRLAVQPVWPVPNSLSLSLSLNFYLSGREEMYVKNVLAITSLSILMTACGGSSSVSTPDTTDSSQTDGSDQTDGSVSESGNGTDEAEDSNDAGETDVDTTDDNGADVADGSQADGGQTNESDSSGGVNRIGSLGFEQVGTEAVFSSGGFFNQSSDQPVDFAALFEDQINTCEVFTQNEDTELEFPFDVSQSISAGETITITSAAGTYGSLTRDTFSDESMNDVIVYVADGTLTAPLPQNLVLDIPGDEFATFSNVSVPNVSRPDISPTVQEVINSGTEFQWTGSSEAFALVRIEATFAVDNGEIVDVTCIAADDGNFSFPENVVSRVGTAEASSVIYSRQASTITTQGSDQVFVTNSFEEMTTQR